MGTASIIKTSALIVAALFAAIAFYLTYFTVGQYERAVVTRWGKVAYVADPGLHFKIPFVDSAHFFRTDIQSMAAPQPANTYTVDNQELNIVFTLFYRVPASKVAFVYENARDYQHRLFNMATDRLKAEMGKVSVGSVAQSRGAIRDTIRDVLAKDAETLGVEVTDFQLTDISYSPQFRDVVEQAAAARQMVETREQEKQQAIRVAERVRIEAEGVANAQREQAAGEADAKLLVAKAEAQAIRLRGEAEADAIRAQGTALGANSALVELRRVERWSGNVPTHVYAGAPIPFLNVQPQN